MGEVGAEAGIRVCLVIVLEVVVVVVAVEEEEEEKQIQNSHCDGNVKGAV